MTSILPVAALAAALTALAVAPAVSQSQTGAGYNNGRTGLSVGASNEASASQSALGGTKPHKARKSRAKARHASHSRPGHASTRRAANRSAVSPTTGPGNLGS
jgi:hypothetical protein